MALVSDEASLFERERALARASAEGRFQFWWRLLSRIALLALICYAAWRIKTVLTTILVAMVVASAAGALVRPLMRLRIPFLKPKAQKTYVTALVFLFLFAAIGLSVQALFHPFSVEWDNLQTNWPTYRETLLNQLAQAKAWYANLPPEVRKYLEAQSEGGSFPSPGAYVGRALGATATWASHIVELILIPVLAFYFTLDTRSLRSEVLFLVPKARLRSTMAILDEGSAILREYIIAQFWLAFIAAVVVGVFLSAIQMPYALILALFAGITRAIPVIGPLVGGVPLTALAFVYGVQTGRPQLWLWVTLAFSIMHVVESKIIMPKFLGSRLHLHAATVIIALLVGGEFFGLMGMFLAPPLAALARVLIVHFVVNPRKEAERAAKQAATAVNINGNGRVLRLERAIRAGTPTARIEISPRREG